MKQDQRLSRILGQNVKLKIGQAVPLYLARVRYVKDPNALYLTALSTLKPLFPGSSAEEADVLAYYLVSRTAASETSERTSLKLQLTMERRSKFITTLTNLSNKISTTQDTIVQNIK